MPVETKEFSTFSEEFHHLSVFDLDVGSSSELIITSKNPGSTPTQRVYVYDSELGGSSNPGDTAFTNINGATFDNLEVTLAIGELDKDHNEEELIVFPWYEGNFRKPDSYDSKLLPTMWEWGASIYTILKPLTDIDGYLYSYLSQSTTFPSATIVDVNNDSLNDIILSNGRLAILWNVGNATDPSFKFDFDYFKELNQAAPPNPIFSPNAWDYDQDGDYDIAYSYGYDSSGKVRYGMDFFENQGSQSLLHMVLEKPWLWHQRCPLPWQSLQTGCIDMLLKRMSLF